ncbi:Ldh family oxidoreductase [Aliirhizobium smilacinae]|uniref:Ldh family oxidoreductase n=1 Tax=Aliirhizobium smilacinae TaxID=1395944 RepID=A0A5C4XT72_9HYPH|nr:Ldh family oxidoreductase [Rhizobium smilacinae]TNM66575.1 Ldh family oxidoreductase [Rhizobium smilacinae]
MHLSLTEAETLVLGIFEDNGVLPSAAVSVARALVQSEAAGQSGHGFRRVPAYIKQVRTGKVDGAATPQLTRPRPAVLSIDAAHGFAYPALDLAVTELPAVAREQGIAFAAIGRSHHAGVMALTVERFAEQGLIAMMFANVPAAMAPWGGKSPLFGTNPIAFAVPVADADALVIDLALSKVARGKVMEANQKGKAIPDDWAFDIDGNPTTDAAAALKGTMAPSGGAKGAALALMVEVLSAGLAGANFSYEASSLFEENGPPPELGHTIIAIDPDAANGGGTSMRMASLAEEMAKQDGVRLPGRRGRGLRADALANGIEIEDDVLKAIDALR